MRRENGTYSFLQRMGALLLAAVMVFGLIPTTTVAADDDMLRLVGQTNTVSDPATHTRLDGFYGQSTLNAGKITVDKSVSDSAVTVSSGSASQTFTPGDDNFIVTVSQAAQVMGLTSQSSVPLDVVFILDTSGSMNQNGVNRASEMVTAANDAIATLMEANEHNRVAVVAFSSNNYGEGSSNGAAANVLSSLAHYTGDAAANHLRWVNKKGAATGTREYIAGRDVVTITVEGDNWWDEDEVLTVNAFRRGYNGGTNIQAGIIAGAKLLTDASTTTTVVTEGGVVTRMPFIVILSDGQPTYSIDDAAWYNPTATTQQGNGSSAYAGNGFLPALVAAYYKAKVTEKYYGTNANEDNRCSIYTIGVQLKEDLAEMTLNPSEHFVAGSQNDYYSNFNTYWTNFSKNNPQNFDIKVNSNDDFQTTAASIRAARDAVNGKSSTGAVMYQGGLKYNDDYFAADEKEDIAKAFQNVMLSIQKKSMSSPTRVDAAFGADFSGYVTFTDPIGEYMEVKQMYGIMVNGQWYRGQSFAQHIQNWNSAPQSFKDSFTRVLEQRCKLSSSVVDVDDLINAALNSTNQAYSNASGYNNSIVWWGNGFTAAGEEDEQVQILGFADNDTVEYITDPSTRIPEDADYVCRSYFYYGTAGDNTATPSEEFLYFMVRVQRSLTAPYQQTVVVSVPASLLSVEQVMITEHKDENGVSYTAAVTHSNPSHVIYEVGLRSDINPFNVDQIVGADEAYKNETAVIDGETKYTNYSANGKYTFYTNDWNRNEPEDSHHRAGATATFDAAADNSFYTYQEDTLIYVKQGDNYVPYTGNNKPVGDGYYYAREYYDWTGAKANADGSYDADKLTAYIAVDIPANAEVKHTDGQWYIPKGLYKASSLTGGEDVYKDDPSTSGDWKDGNFTETSEIISHPHRTESITNSHYTVVLGNNGKLSLQSEKTKNVDINANEPDGIINADGKPVMVGDELTYTVKIINGGETTADAVATDIIPAGTEYVKDSASHNGVYDEDTGIITWNLDDIAAGGYVAVSFKVVVTEAALSGNQIVTIDNTAHVTLGNGFSYSTNTTTNPPEGKKVADTDGNPIERGVTVPQVLVYRIQWYNDAVDANGMPAEATVTVTDIIPEGTTYVMDSASHGGQYNAQEQTMTWTFKAAPGASGVVSFRVSVNADAGEHIRNGASVSVNNNPRVTNQTELDVLHGNLVLSKNVVANDFPKALDQTFILEIVDISQTMNGTYVLLKDGRNVDGGIQFVNGYATVAIKHGEKLEIQGIPVGAVISVTEQAKTGFTPAYYVNGSTTASAAEGRVTITENENAVSVINTYDPLGVSYRIEGTKNLNTEFVVEDTVFGFTAYVCDKDGNVEAGAAYLTGEVTVSSEKKSAEISFSPVTFDAAGTYYYLISEIDGGVTGVTYANEQYLLKITVTDDGSGQLQAEAKPSKRTGTTGSFAAADDVVFVNTYAPHETQLKLTGTKVLTGRDLQEGDYSFVVTDADNNVVSTGYNKEDGEIIFREITYTTPGTYTYTITEVNSGKHGVEYSTASYTVTVKVVDQDGKLVATADYPDGGVVFTNKFTPDGISVVLEATKVLKLEGVTGRVLEENEFNFVVEDAEGNVVATGMNDASGKIYFSPIGYTMADAGKTYTYTVREVVPTVSKDPYMSYDTEPFQVKVTVSYDTDKGELSYSVEYPADTTFTNTQYPSSIDVFPVADKTTLDKNQSTQNVPKDATFAFSVVNVETGMNAAVGVGEANGSVNFSSLTFTQAGTYRYWIKESHGDHDHAHGIVYDTTVYMMEVVVTNTDGKLDYTVHYYTLKDGGDATKVEDYTVAVPNDMPTFKNTYDAQGYIAITAKKILTGLKLKDGDFAFRLVRVDTGVEIGGVVDSNGNVQFATLYYDLSEFTGAYEGADTKIIHYQMSEIEPSVAKIPGVTYDTVVRDVYITITHDDKGNITARITDAQGNPLADAEGNPLKENDSNVTFNNSYNPQQGTSATISGTKILTGRKLSAGEFSFELYHVDGGNRVLVDTVTNGEDGSFSFTRNYPANILGGQDSRVVEYIIREVNNRLGGVEYDIREFSVTVTIVDNKDGTLSADVVYNGLTDGQTVPTFSNTYDAQDTNYAPVAKKTLLNRNLKAGEFSFVVTDKDGAVVSTGMNAADGSVTFSPIGYEKAGEYVYTVSEVKGNLSGMSYDDTVFYLQVTVVDQGDGTMKAEAEYFADAALTEKVTLAEFTNTYTPANVSVQMEAGKILTGRDMEAGEFSFVVLDENGKVVATGGNAEAKAAVTAEVRFSNIGYNLADAGKTFVYTIKELATGQGGVTFDGTLYYAKVTVTNNQTTGMLETSVKYFSDRECTAEINRIIFSNNYAPASVSLDLPVDKTLINKVLEAGEFTFNLYQTGSDFKVLGNPVQSAVNAADGSVDFTELVFTAPGKYYYVVDETVTAGDPDKLYTMDDPFFVVITVTDNLKGQLVATAEYFEQYTADGENTNLGGIEFINNYTAPELTVPLTTQIGAQKTVVTPDGITYSAAGFRFAVTDITGATIKGYVKDDAGQWVEVDMIGVSDANGDISFPNFRFDKAGEYRYRLQELDSGKGGIAEDGRVWEIHILVRYNETTGLLYVADQDVRTFLTGEEGTVPSAPEFVNTYTANGTKLYLTASKKLTGIRELKDREFALYLLEGDTIVAYGFNDANGNVRFEVEYTSVGTHFYSVKEYIPQEGLGGITYDEKIYASVTVEVRDNGEGKLVAYVGGKAVSDGATLSTGVTVTNRYDAEEATAVILAHKALLGDRPLGDGEFTFELVDSEGDVIATAVNDHDGHVEFVLDGYKTPGKFTYTIREKKGSLGGITYDEESYTVTVTVVDDGKGQLHASVAYDTDNGHAPIFTNSYEAAPTQAEIKAHKTLSGEKPLAAEKYTFELEDSEGNVITATNNTAGDVVFTLDYDEVGEYTYVLREKKGDEPGTTYDDTVFNVVVKVVDDLNGKLVATVVYEGVEEGKVPGFVNSYKGAAVPVLVTATKKLEGRTLKAGEFSFVLVNNKDEKESYTAVNDAQGNVGFNLTFKDPGVYTYTMYEKAGTDDNIKYDTARYTVTVTVTDGLDGYMKAVVAYETTGGAAPVFKNVHTPDSVVVTLEGIKTMVGASLGDCVFEFQVRDSEKNVVAEGKNDAQGKIIFDGITFDKPGTYTYTVTERNTGMKYVKYDTSSFTVKVEVTDEDGELKAKVTYPDGKIEFKNEYKKPDPGSPDTGDKFPLVPVLAVMALSGALLVVLLLFRKKKGTYQKK